MSAAPDGAHGAQPLLLRAGGYTKGLIISPLSPSHPLCLSPSTLSHRGPLGPLPSIVPSQPSRMGMDPYRAGSLTYLTYYVWYSLSISVCSLSLSKVPLALCIHLLSPAISHCYVHRLVGLLGPGRLCTFMTCNVLILAPPVLAPAAAGAGAIAAAAVG